MINTMTPDDLNFLIQRGEQPEFIIFGLKHKPRMWP